MALEDVLARIPGRGGYLAQQQYDDRRNQSALGQLLGVVNMVEQQKQRELQAQMQQAQLQEFQRRAAEERETVKRLQGLGQQFQALQQPTQVVASENDSIETPGMSADDALRKLVPQMIFDPNAAVANRGSTLAGRLEGVDQRRDAAQQSYLLRQQALADRRDAELARAQDARARDAALNEYRQGMLDLRRESIATRAAVAGTRQAPIVQTAEGIFERRPEGLVRLTDPATGKPLRPASLTAGDRGDRRDAMSIYEKVESDPQVKTFKSITPKFDTALEYFNTVQKEPAKQSNAQDLAMVKTFVAMIHPKGDQISNMDMKNIGQLPGIDERIVGAVQNVIEGKQLQPKVRADIMRLMAAQYGSLNSQVVGIEDRRREEAQAFGLDPEKSVPKIGRRQGPAQAPQPSIDDIVRKHLSGGR